MDGGRDVVEWLTADKLLRLIDISALSEPCVLAHVISLVGWPKHVEIFQFFFSVLAVSGRSR